MFVKHVYGVFHDYTEGNGMYGTVCKYHHNLSIEQNVVFCTNHESSYVHRGKIIHKYDIYARLSMIR